MNRKPTSSSLPTVEQLEAELKRETSRKRHKQSAKTKEMGDSSSSFVDQLEEELKRDTYKKRYWHMLRSTVSILIVVAAIVVLTVSYTHLGCYDNPARR